MGCGTSTTSQLREIERKLDEMSSQIDAIQPQGRGVGPVRSLRTSSRTAGSYGVANVARRASEKSSSLRSLSKDSQLSPDTAVVQDVTNIREDGYDAFISHCKRLPESEDRAVWVADILECRGLSAFFDRSCLTEISEAEIKRAMLAADVCITVVDPVAFHSQWVFRENRLAYNAGIPIIPVYDADRFRWSQLQKWNNLYPWAFSRKALPITKDKRHTCINQILEAVEEAKLMGRVAPAKQIQQEMETKVQVQIGAGASRETETASAVDAAHKAMLSKIAGAAPAVIIVSFTCTHDAQKVASRVHELCPDTPMVGCTTCRGVVLNSAWVTHNKEYAVGMWCVCDDGGTYRTVHIQKRAEGAAALQQQVQSQVAKALEARADDDPSFVILLGSPGDEEIIIAGIHAAAGADVPVVGGSSADNAVTGAWRQIAKAGVSSLKVQEPTVSDAGITILVGWSSCQIATTLTSGFRQTQKKGYVTEVSKDDHGRTIQKIDGRPVKDVYEKWTGGSITSSVQWDGDKAVVLAPSSFCPLGECYGEAEDSYVRVLHPAFLYKSSGALTTFADAYEGMPVTLLDAAPETLAKKISQSANMLMSDASRQCGQEPMERRDVVGALMIFCGGLVMAIDDKMPLAAEQLADTVGQQNTMGICCFGEQGMNTRRKAIHGNLMFGCLLFTNKSASCSEREPSQSKEEPEAESSIQI